MYRAIVLLFFFMYQDGVARQPSALNTVNVVIDVGKTYQTIQNFGASDAWAAQFVGKWPDSTRNKIADLLFSTAFDQKGKPKGIGLSIWRFNFGAGSTEQGRESGIRDEWRRAESFFDNSGNYDANKQQGQQWFLKAAKARGVDQFLGFYNSPPVRFTKNGKSFSSDGACNIDSGNYRNFSSYITSAIRLVEKNTGIHFNYISPVNEPQWDWKDGGQEGSPFANQQIAALVRTLNAQLEAEKLNTRIVLAEAGKLDYFLADNDKPGRGNQVNDFFAPGANSIGDLSHVEKAIAGHSYFTTSPYKNAAELRQKIKERVQTVPGLNYWMSEYCILGNNANEMNGNRRDLGIKPALYIAKVIHNDLVNANASAWQWWLAISRYDYKDGLVYVDNNQSGGNYYQSKMLWGLGNYSLFVRPAYKRVDARVTNDSAADRLLISSYKDPGNKKLIIVVINTDSNAVRLNLQVKHLAVQKFKPYITSENKDLEPGNEMKPGEIITIPSNAIVTLVGSVR